MKAVIMAGGGGSRLKPLTCDIPKPMIRLCGRPIIEYILDLLCDNGITEGAVTTHYLPDAIEKHFPDGKYKNIRLSFIEEDRPLGTAGSVANAAMTYTEPFLVISGDCMCDFDLRDAFAHHRRKGADATLILKHVDDPREYGLARAENGYIKGFVEKPCYAQAVCSTANTGVYILNPSCLKNIKKDVSVDFAKDLFPEMLSGGLKLGAYETDKYWCDIGDLKTLRQCMTDMLDGKVFCDMRGRSINGIIYKGSLSADGSYIKGPCYIGPNVRIGGAAHIDPYTVIDGDVIIGEGCHIKSSVIYSRASIGAESHLSGAIVGHDAYIGKKAQIFENAAIGAGALIGAKAVIEAGVKIWNKKYVEDETVQKVNLQMGNGRKELFDDDGMLGRTNIEITPDFCAAIGRAAGTYQKRGVIGLSCSGEASAEAMAASLCAGILSTGCDVWDFGASFESRTAFLTQCCDLDFALHIAGGEQSRIKIILRGGLSSTRAMERELEQSLSRGEFLRADYKDFGRRVNMSSTGNLYSMRCEKAAERPLSGLRLYFDSGNGVIKSAFYDIAKALGIIPDKNAETKLIITDDGSGCHIESGSLGSIGDPLTKTYLANQVVNSGRDVSFPADLPLLSELVENGGKGVLRYMSCPAGGEDGKAREIFCENSWLMDGICCGLKMLEALKYENAVLAEFIKKAENYSVVKRTLPISKRPGDLMDKISGEVDEINGGGIEEGVRCRYRGGSVFVRPTKRGNRIKIIAQANGEEIAEEICSSFINDFLS
ncbi:MAG: NTP transferase domain-containing protein [Oscillospiraceae bacterium]|jgi:mannose-1-phosphate guanylyltransferase/phosphomannomutase|nr:NTP transferase domain-containing protein [Oscillospiraceae bacterium]